MGIKLDSGTEIQADVVVLCCAHETPKFEKVISGLCYILKYKYIIFPRTESNFDALWEIKESETQLSDLSENVALYQICI